jgi:SAM-dependent methyltransferase
VTSPPHPVADRFFVVGPNVVLRGWHRELSRELSLEAVGRTGHFADVRCRLVAGTARIALEGHGQAFAAESAGEALRLFVRVVVKRFAKLIQAVHVEVLDGAVHAALVCDGFQLTPNRHELVSERLDYLRSQQASDMESVYADPFTIPWNLVPVDLDVVTGLIARTPPGGRVLDLGCGFGKNAHALADGGVEVHGVDISRAAVTRAREVLGREHAFVVGSADRLPFRATAFEAVMDVGCLHCMPAGIRPKAVREIARVLAPSGTLHSRMFRPRSAAWLAAQPFRTEAFGLEPKQAADLLRHAFDSVTVRMTPDITYLTATEPVP